ncbi:hypothetical protein IEO70_14800 [Bacillus sp. AGMB 02131]|uniref:Uncharacterized protein n=1 Tax=Peribacillus faecalis TaxID=2772559 RepID=A0A927HC40_9BACI|nr:hypothetical protein [Peribacillus faecalis]MBD3109614.1 hypothetical protein [Peribacillus faecalis]
MEIQTGSGMLLLPSIPIMIGIAIIIILLVRWSKQLETRRYNIFFHFLISTITTPVFSASREDGVFQLWLPLGFIIVCLHLFRGKSYHPAKLKASLLGLSIALYKLFF